MSNAINEKSNMSKLAEKMFHSIFTVSGDVWDIIIVFGIWKDMS